jgi:hypothetical protein
MPAAATHRWSSRRALRVNVIGFACPSYVVTTCSGFRNDINQHDINVLPHLEILERHSRIEF